MPALYDAALPGVRALLPHRRIAPDTRPDEGAVELFLERVSGQVRARVGDLTAYADGAAYADAARLAVELGAAAMAEDAAFPERASTADSDYGAVLWTRYREALADLVAILNLEEAAGGSSGGGVEVPVVSGRAVASFPEPLLRREVAF